MKFEVKRIIIIYYLVEDIVGKTKILLALEEGSVPVVQNPAFSSLDPKTQQEPE